MNDCIAIAGIHTGIGKTVVAAVLTEALGAHYWKPVQAGIEERDAALVRRLITDGETRVHEEAVVLSQPLSPHAAAAIDGVDIDYTRFAWPAAPGKLLVETAGGLLSPMSATTTMADFIAHYRLPTVLVSQNYLGSINHTLLTLEVLKSRGIKVLGIIVNDGANPSSESFIESYGGVPVIAHVPHFYLLNRQTVCHYAASIATELQKYL